MSSNSRNSIQSGHSCGSSSEFGFKTDIFEVFFFFSMWFWIKIGLDFFSRGFWRVFCAQFRRNTSTWVVYTRIRKKFQINFFVRFFGQMLTFAVPSITYVRISAQHCTATERTQQRRLLYSVFQLTKLIEQINPSQRNTSFIQIFEDFPANLGI